VAHTSGLIAATRRILAVCLPFAPFAVIAAVLVAGFAKGPFLYDFHGGLYGAGRDIVHGHSPYRPGFIAQQAAVSRAGGEPATIFSVPVYPPPALIAVVPLALLPYKLAGLLWIAASVGALLLTLRLLGVVDRRCYALAFASWPIVHGLLLGAVTPFLCLCTAVAWRYRKRALVAGGAVAAVAVAKLFLWPLAVWLVFQRRLRAAGFALLVALGSTLAAWAAISFAGFTIYPRMLANLAYVSESAGVSLVAGLMRLGADEGPARVAALTAALLLLLASARLGRARDGDRRAFTLAIVAALVASPIVWPHYLELLIIPIAVASPRLSPLWWVPLLTWAAPVAQTRHHPWAIAPDLALVALVGFLATRPLDRPRRAVAAVPFGSGVKATRP